MKTKKEILAYLSELQSTYENKHDVDEIILLSEIQMLKWVLK